jgi:hypothetical protein
MKRIEFDKRDPKGPEQLALKLMINSCYGKLAEKKFRGIDPVTNEPIIPPHASPWYASAITAHTRRELMNAALHAPELIIQFATDAVYSEIPLALPRLKSEVDIKAGKEDKLLGDWCWSTVAAAVFIQSGLAFYCDYDPNAIASFKADNIARHATAEIKAFMPLASAIASPEKFKKLFCKWGEIKKTVWLDDAGAKRDIAERDLDTLTNEAVETTPKINQNPEILSALRFPDWVEDARREEKRQKAAINQFHRIDEEETAAYKRSLESEDAEFIPASEIDRLLEMNETIEV